MLLVSSTITTILHASTLCRTSMTIFIIIQIMQSRNIKIVFFLFPKRELSFCLPSSHLLHLPVYHASLDPPSRELQNSRSFEQRLPSLLKSRSSSKQRLPKRRLQPTSCSSDQIGLPRRWRPDPILRRWRPEVASRCHWRPARFNGDPKWMPPSDGGGPRPKGWIQRQPPPALVTRGSAAVALPRSRGDAAMARLQEAGAMRMTTKNDDGGGNWGKWTGVRVRWWWMGTGMAVIPCGNYRNIVCYPTGHPHPLFIVWRYNSTLTQILY